MSRACCCNINHADAISSITTIQDGYDAIGYAKSRNHGDIVPMLDRVSVCVCDGVCVVYVCVLCVMFVGRWWWWSTYL